MLFLSTLYSWNRGGAGLDGARENSAQHSYRKPRITAFFGQREARATRSRSHRTERDARAARSRDGVIKKLVHYYVIIYIIDMINKDPSNV